MSRFARPLFAVLTPILLASLIASLIVILLGERPAVLWESMAQTLFTGFGLGHSLYYASSFIFTGLAVAICAHCGLFNIGAEGQLHLGALGLTLVGVTFTGLPPLAAIPTAIFASALFGGIWGAIAGLLKAKRGSHEVIVTIVLNFLGIAFVNYCLLHPLRNMAEQNPESHELGPGFLLPHFTGFFDNTPVNASLLLALTLCGLVHFLLFHTTIGYRLRVVGAAPRAATFAGISVDTNIVLAFLLAGAMAGLCSLNDIAGYHHKLAEGFSPGYGFTGIAVALIVRNRPLLIPLSAFLFGALQNASREIEFSSEIVSKEVALFLQGVLVAVAVMPSLYDLWKRRAHA